MVFIEDLYCDFLYDCFVANKLLSEEDWIYYGKETHHTEIPKCEGGELTLLNSQDLTTYQHWVAGVLQSEVIGRKCFAMIPRGVLPPVLETIRLKWQTHHNRTYPFENRVNPMEGRNHTDATRSKMSESHKGKTHTEETKRKIGEKHKGKVYSPETLQKMRENSFRIDGWVWITNNIEETMVPPEFVYPEDWHLGRKPVSEETRIRLSKRMSGESNPMFGVAPKSKQMRWYKNLSQMVEKMFIPGEEPSNWIKGRLTSPDRSVNPTLL